MHLAVEMERTYLWHHIRLTAEKMGERYFSSNIPRGNRVPIFKKILTSLTYKLLSEDYPITFELELSDEQFNALKYLCSDRLYFTKKKVAELLNLDIGSLLKEIELLAIANKLKAH